MLLTSVCAGVSRASEPREVQLLKSHVIQYEPVYARVFPTVEHWKHQGFETYFEMRKSGAKSWTPCPKTSVYPFTRGTPADTPRIPQGPIILNRLEFFTGCELNDVGEYEIRWMDGVPETLVVMPVPAEEAEAAALMTGKPVTDARFQDKFPSSVYAGYVLLGYFPGPAQGPAFAAELRASITRLTVENLRFLDAQFSAQALALETQLLAHPEFIFADEARLHAAYGFVFVGQCDAALRQLMEVTSDQWRGRATRYLEELAAVRSAPHSVCTN